MSAGKIFVEIDIDASKFDQADKKLKASSQATGAAVESNFKSIGATSAAIFDSMKTSVEKSFTAMASYAKSAATTIYDAMKSAATWTREAMKSAAGWVGDAFKGVSQSVKDFVSQTSSIMAGMAASWAAQKTAVSLFGQAAGAAISAVITWVGAAIIAYKSLDFAIGLITGKSYKSEAIDWLIAETAAVKELSTTLETGYGSAQTFKAAMDSVGVSGSDITATYGKVEAAVRTNTEELDRLGIQYEDSNGVMLDQKTILENSYKVLGQYTEGWDRNQAAAAIGMGTYEQIGKALTVTSEAQNKARETLDSYNAGISTETEAATKAYTLAMASFNSETKMMSDGLTRAIADQIMPAFTSLATYFTDGWPFIVNLFRYSMATITSLGWGLYNGFALIKEGWKLIFSDIGSILSGFTEAAIKALTGDFEGAKKAITGIFKDVSKNSDATWDAVKKASEKSASAMAMAWAMDGRKVQDTAKTTGKTWEAATKDIVDNTKAGLSELEKAEKALAAELAKTLADRKKYEGSYFEWKKAEIELGLEKYKEAGVSEERIAELRKEKLINLNTEIYTAYKKTLLSWEEDTKKKQADMIAAEDKAAQDEITGAEQKRAAMRNLYKDLQGYSGLYYEVEGQLIQQQAENYDRILIDEKTSAEDAAKYEVAIATWKTNELKKLDIEKGKSSDDFFAGFKAGIDEMELKQKKWGSVGVETMLAMSSAMSSTFATAFEDAYKGKLQSIGDYSKAIWDSTRQAFFKAASDMGSQAIMIGLKTQFTPSSGDSFRLIDKLGQLGGWAYNLYDTWANGPGVTGELPFAGYAEGGTPPVGKPVWVGEKGPELLFLNSPGYVMEHNQSVAYAVKNGGFIPGYATGGMIVDPMYGWTGSIDDAPSSWLIPDPNYDGHSPVMVYGSNPYDGGRNGWYDAWGTVPTGLWNKTTDQILALLRSYNSPSTTLRVDYSANMGIGDTRSMPGGAYGDYYNMYAYDAGRQSLSFLSGYDNSTPNQATGAPWQNLMYPIAMLAAAYSLGTSLSAVSGATGSIGGMTTSAGAMTEAEMFASAGMSAAQASSAGLTGITSTWTAAEIAALTTAMSEDVVIDFIAQSVLKQASKYAMGMLSPGGSGGSGGLGGSMGALDFAIDSISGGEGIGATLNELFGTLGKSHVISARNGLDYVPRDNTIVNTHEGEAVITKDENKRRLSGKSGGNTYVFNLHATVADRKTMNDFAEQIYPRLEKLRAWGH